MEKRGENKIKMTKPVIHILFSGLIIQLVVGAQLVKAQQFDIEIDPIAYALKGFSVHGGYLIEAWRIDLGIYGLEIPEAVHGNDGFDSKFFGTGWKLDRFFKGQPDGFFVGVDGGVSRLQVTHQGSNQKANRIEYSLGVRIGYRWNTGLASLYITPWLGLGYTLNAKNLTVNGETFENSAFQPFPTVHVGWKF